MPSAAGDSDAWPERVTQRAAIGVAGAGAWGMALANAAAAAGREVVLWGRDPERMRRFEATRVSDRLP
ncbi:NAD(P)-binding domain-containing protein, partial [Roseiarcus sp.]|uniref:NAD(P)-binding domain-containing protein n=1 Tax=Roseiarcus sp. TaxID=1969460 RepID=UPI003C323A03